MNRDEIARDIGIARDAIAHGRLDQAGAIAARILRAAPASIDALEIDAMVARARGAHAAAERSLRAAIAAAPDRRWPYDDLGRLLIEQGRTDDAEAVTRAALVGDPANPDAHAMLGTLLSDREALVPGAHHLDRAIALAGPHPQLLAALGRNLARQGRLTQARALLQQALARDPEGLLPLVHLAEVEEQSGDFAAATRLLDRAEPIAARSGRDILLQRTVLMARSGASREALALLDRRDDLSGAALLQRGRLRDQTGRFDDAWGDFTTGKARLAESGSRHYDADRIARDFAALARFFTPERRTALPVAPPADGPQPIFILGFPRSGTTLTEQLLASHSRVIAGGELPFGRALRDAAATLAGGEAAFPDGLAECADRAWPERLRDLYLDGARSFGLRDGDAAYFTDKMPLNETWLPLLRLAFPDAPIVVVQRHPLDILVSVMAHDMTHGFNCGYRIEDAAQHLAAVDALMARYVAAEPRAPYLLRYEALIADQHGETERLMRYLALEPEPAQLRFHENPRFAPTPSYAQVQAPLHDRSIGRWRNYARQLAPIVPRVRAAIDRAGYSA